MERMKGEHKMLIKKYLTKSYIKDVIILMLGSAILAFGLYHIHSQSNVTEGGVLGLTLLLQEWLHISPAVSSLVMNAICYYIGWKTMGIKFIVYSGISGAAFSGFYAFFVLNNSLSITLSSFENRKLSTSVAASVAAK